MPDKGDKGRSVRFLLSGGRLSGPDHDRILAEVIRRSSAGERRPRAGRWAGRIGAVLLPVAAVVVLVLGRHLPAERDRWLAAKGGSAGAGQAVLQAHCPGRPSGTCTIGDRLVFEMDGATEGGLLAAFAEGPMVGDSHGGRIWYFPTREGHLAPVPPGRGHTVIGEAARVGDEHAAGKYLLHLFLLRSTDRTTDRAALAAGKVHALSAAVLPLEVRR
jgi:hypothetical protein